MRARLVTLVALAVLVTGAAAALAAEPRHEPVHGPDPAVSRWPEWPHPVSCGGLPFDAVAAFSGPTDAERGRGAPERALRRYLVATAPFGGRQHDWRALSRGHGRAEFAAGRLFTGSDPDEVPALEWLSIGRAGGRLTLRAFDSGCTPRSLRHGVPAVSWTLAEGQRLSPATRQVRVDLFVPTLLASRPGGRSGPVECEPGPLQKPRIQKPEFREQSGELILTLWPRRASHLCPGPVGPLLVKLPEALGERELFDGGTYPPLPALRAVDAG